jgi:hypothetical protein
MGGMNLINKKFNITLDINQTATIKYKNMILVSGDINAYHFDISLVDNGSPLDLTSVDHAWVIFRTSANTVVQGTLQITDTLTGKLTYTLGSQEISKEGVVFAEIELYGSNNETITSSRFEFYVKKELNTDDAVKSSTQYSVLTNLINNVKISYSDDSVKSVKKVRIGVVPDSVDDEKPDENIKNEITKIINNEFNIPEDKIIIVKM